MMLLHDCIVVCNWFLVFVVVDVGFFEALPKKMACFRKKPIQIIDPYGSYGLVIRINHKDQ